MIIRKIKPLELKRTSELFSIAFEIEGENEDSAEEIMQDILEHPASREDQYWEERWAAFQDDDQTMMSYFITQPFPIQFDGGVYRMAGIGGVATLPQYRGTGAIRRCFEAALPDLYEKGVAFSYLYPFSTAFYRQFGYEMGCACNSWRVKLNAYRPFAVGGSCELVEPGHTMLSEIQSIYRSMQNKYNMMIANEEFEFAWVGQSNPVEQQTFTYVFCNGQNIPKGYMTLKPLRDEGRNLLCTRFCFTDPEGIRGLLNMLLAFKSDHEEVILELPTDVDLTLLLAECAMKDPVESTRKFLGMVRVVDAEQVLMGARYLGSGELLLQIHDAQISQNNGFFDVKFVDGKAKQVIRSETGTPEIEMDIQSFSRLIIGAGDSRDFPYMDQVRVHQKSAGIGQVFYRKPNLILQYF